jgi:hypothetical protein
VLRLNKENIKEWKSELDKIFTRETQDESKYSDTLSDIQWLEDYEGETPAYAVEEELSCS